MTSSNTEYGIVIAAPTRMNTLMRGLVDFTCLYTSTMAIIFDAVYNYDYHIQQLQYENVL